MKNEKLALLILLLGITVFHWRGIRPGQTFLPVDLANQNLPWGNGEPKPLQNTLVSDPLYQFFPFTQDAIEQVKSGSWPMWNTDVFLGHPSVADPLGQPFYPVILLFGLIFGAAKGLALGLWFQVVLAAILTYGWLRAAGSGRPGAIAGAFTFSLSGYLVTWFETTFWVSTLSLLPGVLWSFELAVRRRSFRYAAASSLLLALAVLGGQFQFIVIFSLFLGAYALGHMMLAQRNGSGSYSWPMVVLASMIVPVSLISAVFVLPTVEFIPLTRRLVSVRSADALPMRYLVTLVIPDFFGNPSTANPYWGEGNFAEYSIYTGLVSLLLASMAPFASRRRFYAGYMALIFLGALYFVVGGPGVDFLVTLPVLEYSSVHRAGFILPLLAAMMLSQTLSAERVPVKKAMVATFLLLGVSLAAYFVDTELALSRWDLFIRAEFLQAGLMLLATLFLLFVWRGFPDRAEIAKWSLTGLIFVDLLLAGSKFNPVGPIRELMPITPAIRYLQENVGQHRVVALQREDNVLFGPNVLSIFGLAEAGGYSSLVNSRYHKLVAAGDPELDVWWMQRSGNMVTFSNPSLRLLDMFQVSHVVSPGPIEFAGGIGAEQINDSCERSTGQIGRTTPFNGRFAVRDLAINRIDFRFSVADPLKRAGVMSIRLWQGEGRERLILDTPLSAADLVDEQVVPLFFAPETDAPGSSYVWEIAAPHEDASGISLCASALGEPAVSVYGGQWVHVYQDDVYIAERLAPLPRAYVVYAAEPISDDDQAVKRILDEHFDLRNSAIIAVETTLPITTTKPATPATLLEYEDNKVQIQVTTDRDGLLVLGDQFHPGWTAELDGNQVQILRTNLVMRGVSLPAGEHTVLFAFKPTSVRRGAWLSSLGLLILAIMIRFDRSFSARFAKLSENG